MIRPVRVALLGECMIELQGQAFGTLTQGFGGDTLNTAVYLARCGGAAFEVHYATALGDDGLSQGMVERWQAEGLRTDLVQRLPGRVPGLYMIELDDSGERRFVYWRDSAAARAYFDAPVTPLEAQAANFDAFYLSGISLAILPPAARERVFALMEQLRERGAAVIFDNNYRPRLWPDVAVARQVFARAFALASCSVITADDHQLLMGLSTLNEAVAAAQALASPELLIKRGAGATLVRAARSTAWHEAATEPVPRVVDTTAAGDSFAAGYLSRRLAGADAVDAACFGNRVAGRVIQHRGALILREVMRDLMPL